MPVIFILGLVGGISYLLYANIIGKRNNVLESLADIDVQLSKRHDLIPNLLKIAERFMEHENDLMMSITAQRGKAQAGIGSVSTAAIEKHLNNEGQLQDMMTKFFAVAESYPQMKSDGPMMQAQQAYSETEEHIAAARRFYNSAVTALNNAIQIFPGSLFAGWANVNPYPFYKADETDRASVDASAYLKQAV